MDSVFFSFAGSGLYLLAEESNFYFVIIFRLALLQDSAAGDGVKE